MISRREMMIASSGMIGLSPFLSWQLQASTTSIPLRRNQKKCVLIFLSGGPSQLDTLDPKPFAPGGHGGPLRPISTNVAGIQISESLPGIAKLMDRCAIIRSMSTKERQHALARFHLHTGYLRALSLDFPSMGAVVSYFHADDKINGPRYVHLGGGNAYGCSSGFLGARHSPLKVENQIPYLKSGVNGPEYARRIELLLKLEQTQIRKKEGLFTDHRETVEKSLDFMNSTYPSAFDQNQEPLSVRERYGNTEIGKACLQARRLLENEISFVEVHSGHWDMHGNIYDANRGIDVRAREIDQAVSALVLDLESRGMLDDTLIVWMGEFGRTPKLNPSPGRDHYPDAWSTMLIGGGIPGGQVVGATDKSGETVTDRPVSAVDFLATIYHRLGLDHTREIMGPGNRPLQLVDRQKSAEIIESLR